jgi:hypothetical protein
LSPDTPHLLYQLAAMTAFFPAQTPFQYRG